MVYVLVGSGGPGLVCTYRGVDRQCYKDDGCEGGAQLNQAEGQEKRVDHIRGYLKVSINNNDPFY